MASVKDRNSLQDKRQANSGPRPETRTDGSHLDVYSQHRPLLFSIAYRMLGSVVDAEDKLQETFIRWQQCFRQLDLAPFDLFIWPRPTG